MDACFCLVKSPPPAAFAHSLRARSQDKKEKKDKGDKSEKKKKKIKADSDDE